MRPERLTRVQSSSLSLRVPYARRGCCRDRHAAHRARAGCQSGSAPPRASDRRGSAARCGPRQSRSRHWEMGSCIAPPPAWSRGRARSTSQGRCGRRCPEGKRFGRDLGQLFLDQGGAPVETRRIDRPVALDRPQLCRRVRDRDNGDLSWVDPDTRRPSRRAGRPRRDQQPSCLGSTAPSSYSSSWPNPSAAR